MSFLDAVAERRLILAEGSVYERLRRHPDIVFDPMMRHGTLIYDPAARAALNAIHRSYIAVAQGANLPMALLSSTWRTSAENIAASRFAGKAVNQDNIGALKALRAESGHTLFIGGQTGCRGDAYKPEEALETEAAYRFHRPQIQALAEAAPDYLFAATLPALSEARGIARAMGETGLPYFISFVLRPEGCLLDGTPWADAMRTLDDMPAPPIGHAVNCVHPRVLASALAVLARTDASLPARLRFFQANAANLCPEALAASDALLADPPDVLAEHIVALHERHAIPIVGGCCGTDETHIRALAARLQNRKADHG